MDNYRTYQKTQSRGSNTNLSKTLSYYLRHGAVERNLPIDKEGFVSVAVILSLKEFREVDVDFIKNMVKEDEKKRYQLRTDPSGKLLIRAAQGHSIMSLDHELMMELIVDPILYKNTNIVHGTVSQFLGPIMAEGLKTMARNHVHFAMGYPGHNQVISGARKDCNVFIEMDLELAMKNGIKILRSSNDVILTDGIMKTLPPIFFKKVFKVNSKGARELIFTNEKFEEIRSKYCHRYLLILNLEANCAEVKELNPQEIIEFPVIVLDTWTNKIDEKNIFHHYVKPSHTKLTPFCTKLTGITESMLVQDELDIEDVLVKFDKFLKARPEIAKDFCFVTCGEWDLQTCLKNEAKFKELDLPKYYKRYMNIKDIFGLIYRPKGIFGMTEMLNHLKIPFEGRRHSGIDESRNLAKILQTILSRKDSVIAKTFVKTVE
jgi:RNA:NAD 2'-phosphotransferase (TPT1/KptA family)/inhibitor of KinA sporulation pathway (predicted exonuclease)